MPSADRPTPPGRTQAEPSPEVAQAAKVTLRIAIQASRLVSEPQALTAARAALALDLSSGHRTIALYSSSAAEPDTWGLIDALHERGHTLLLPLLGRRPDGTVRRGPDWGVYAGRDRLRVGYAGIAEPVTEALGSEGLARASVVWCPGLAATVSGDRLGTGGGWYDRALAFASPNALVGVLLRDAEVRAELPVQPFDRRVDVIVTESRVIRTNGGRNSSADSGR